MIHFSAGGRTRVFLSFLQNTSPPKKLIIRKLLGIRTNALIDRQSGWRLRRKGSGSNILELKLNNYSNISQIKNIDRFISNYEENRSKLEKSIKAEKKMKN